MSIRTNSTVNTPDSAEEHTRLESGRPWDQLSTLLAVRSGQLWMIARCMHRATDVAAALTLLSSTKIGMYGISLDGPVHRHFRTPGQSMCEDLSPWCTGSWMADACSPRSSPRQQLVKKKGHDEQPLVQKAWSLKGSARDAMQ